MLVQHPCRWGRSSEPKKGQKRGGGSLGPLQFSGTCSASIPADQSMGSGATLPGVRLWLITSDSVPIPPTTAGCEVQLNLHKRQCPPVSRILLAPTSGWKDLRELGAQHSAQSLACRKCSRCAGHHDSFTPTGTHGQPQQLGLGFASVSGNTGLWCPHFPLFCM